MSDFSGKKVLVTGGGTGIGRATALAFAEGGATVFVAGRRKEPLDEVAGQSDEIHAVTCDVTDEASVEAMYEATGHCDIVVANAGTGVPVKVRHMSLDQWHANIDPCLTGAFLTLRGGLRGMSSGGRLIAVASIAGLKGAPNVGAYVAAKHGVIGLIRSLAHEVAEDGITANAICPGFVDTPLSDRSKANVMKRLDVDEAEAERFLHASNPVGRLITPEECAAAILYLASPLAAMVNGHALSISGGEV